MQPFTGNGDVSIIMREHSREGQKRTYKQTKECLSRDLAPCLLSIAYTWWQTCSRSYIHYSTVPCHQPINTHHLYLSHYSVLKQYKAYFGPYTSPSIHMVQKSNLAENGNKFKKYRFEKSHNQHLLKLMSRHKKCQNSHN